MFILICISIKVASIKHKSIQMTWSFSFFVLFSFLVTFLFMITGSFFFPTRRLTASFWSVSSLLIVPRFFWMVAVIRGLTVVPRVFRVFTSSDFRYKCYKCYKQRSQTLNLIKSLWFLMLVLNFEFFNYYNLFKLQHKKVYGFKT